MMGTASGSSSAAEVLNPVNPSIATTSTPSRLRTSGQPLLERLLRAAFDHVEQAGSARGCDIERSQNAAILRQTPQPKHGPVICVR